ncbi:MAG: hypothetical protein FWD17_00295 [Polyangiaceae bacterium]|nr:hypothetical protein [Polyangiaceae bacterium]
MMRIVVPAALCLAGLVSCKGGSVTPAKFDIDADPVALLPAGPVLVGSLDARAAHANAELGPTLARLAATTAPIGEDAGFVPSRDVDRVVVGVYGGTPAAWVTVMVGRFDAAKLAAATHSPTGAPIVASVYGGFVTHAADRTTYVPLTAHTLLSGSADGIHRTLDRLADPHEARQIPPWMSETLATPGAQLVVAADLQTDPVASATVGSSRLPWVQHLQAARISANFASPGLNVAGTLTYPTEAEAATAGEELQSLGGWVRRLGPLLGGVHLEGLDVKAQARDLHCSFALDDHTLHALVAMAPRFLPQLAEPR